MIGVNNQLVQLVGVYNVRVGELGMYGLSPVEKSQAIIIYIILIVNQPMSEITNLDSIITKYKDLRPPHLNQNPLPTFSSSALHKYYSPAKNNPPEYHILATQPVVSTAQPYHCKQDRLPGRYAPPQTSDQTNALAKYKETLGLLLDEIAKNKTVNEELEVCRKRLLQNQKTLKDMQHYRLAQKLEYGRKLEILSQNQSQSKPGYHNDLTSKFEMLQKQAWSLKNSQDELKRRVRLLEQENSRLNNVSRQAPPLSDYEYSFFKDDKASQSAELKQLLSQLQAEHSTALKDIDRLKEQISQLNQELIDQYERISELEDIASQQKVLNKTARTQRRPKSEIKDDSDQSQRGQNQAIQKKLKTLERDYQKLCSQMLTVESAKKIAKQTSRYYNKKPK